MTQASKEYFRKYYQDNKPRLQEQLKAKRRGQKYNVARVIVIHDPSSEYGFPNGAELNCLKETLDFCSFTPNTVLRVDGKRCVVRENMGRQSLEWLE